MKGGEPDYLVVDARGRPVRFSLTGGQRVDVSQAVPLLTGLGAEAVISEKGYESNRVLAFISEPGEEASHYPSQTAGILGNTTVNYTVNGT